MDIVSTGKAANSILKIGRTIFDKYQLKRFESFVIGCQKTLEEDGVLTPKQEVDYSIWFEQKFAQARLYDYIRKAIDNSSEIARMALAHIFTKFNSGVSSYAPYIESILLRGLADLDNLDIEMFLTLYVIAKKSGQDSTLNQRELEQLESDGKTPVKIWISKELFDLNPSNFSKYGNDPFSIATYVIDSFVSRGIIKSANVLGNYDKGVGFYLTEVSIIAIKHLAWGIKIIDPTSNLSQEL